MIESEGGPGPVEEDLATTTRGLYETGGAGDHLALIYEDRREQLATVVQFIRQGLAQGERCLYVADDNTTEEIVSALNDGGVDVAGARRSGALSIRTNEETTLEAGASRPDPERALDSLEESIEQARDQEGFDGVRIAAEMTLALDDGSDFDFLRRYESLLGSLHSGEDHTVLCQYNRGRFPSELITEAVREHPLVVPGGGPSREFTHCSSGNQGPSGRSQAVAVDREAVGDDSRENAPALASSTVLDAARDPIRVLYVDDSPAYAQMAAEIIERKDGIDTVITETDPQEACARLDDEPVDCVVSDYAMPEMDGLELLRSVRETRQNLPFILVTGKGDEEIASTAVSAGVTDYLRKRGGTEQYTVLANRISNAVEQRRTERAASLTRRQYEKLVERSTDAIAVLDAEGRFRYLSPAAERRLGPPAGELVGSPGFEYVHPEDRATVVERFEKQLDCPEETITTEFRFRQSDDSWTWLEARWRNLLRDPDIGGVVMYARDITDRKKRERELSESERRFRSLFEESFDAMVIADDDGSYVDANAAACDLFELSKEELMGRSTDEFAPVDDDLETTGRPLETPSGEQEMSPFVTADGAERIVEFAATPNVVPGQHLSVIRDVTDREHHERTLSELHHASRDLLGAESDADVARDVVRAATELLSMSAAAVYLFDSDESRLEPTEVSAETIDTDTLEAVPLDRGSIMGSAFLDEESKRIDFDGGTDRQFLSELPLQSGLLFPLGGHGVCFVGETDAAVTDDDQELTEILTAIAETALDRVEKETELREQKRDLQTQNHDLERLTRINAAIREIDTSLLGADTRDEIQRAVCEHLSAYSGIASVWIGKPDTQQQQLVPCEWDGDGGIEQYLDTISPTLEDDSTTPAAVAADTTDPVYVENIADDVHGETWRKPALSSGYRSVLALPITYRGISYGAMSVYADQPDFFDDLSRAALQTLSTRIANVINAVQHQHAVLTESMTELELRLSDESLPLNRIAAQAECSLTLETISQQPEGDVVKFLSAEGADLEVIAEAAAEMTAISEASTVTDSGQEGLVRLRYSGRPLADDLANRGVRVPKLVTDAGTAKITVLVPEMVEISWVLDVFQAQALCPKLMAKTERNRSDGAPRRHAGETYRAKLTPRQQEVLRTAYLSGFFRSPRECTGEELAEHLGVSSQTVYRHVRAAERKLFETVFGGGVNSNAPTRNEHE